MELNATRNYIELIADAIAGNIGEYIINNTEEGSGLTFVNTLNDEYEMGYEIVVSPRDNNMYLTEIRIYMFGEVDEKSGAGINKCITMLNTGIIPGIIIYDRESAAVIHRMGYYFSENSTLDSVVKQLGRSIECMENCLAVIMEPLQGLIKGELNAEQVMKIFEEMEGEAADNE